MGGTPNWFDRSHPHTAGCVYWFCGQCCDWFECSDKLWWNDDFEEKMDSVSKNIYSQRLKSREKQKVERCLRFKDQREMGLKYKRKMKLKAAEIRKKEKSKTMSRSRSRLLRK